MASSWLIGSIKDMPAQEVAVNASGSEDLTVATGSYYLWDSSSSISLVTAFQTALNTHSNLSGVTVTIREDRKVEITSGTAFTLTWTDTEIRDALGFTGNLTSNTVHVAPNVSPLLWSPGRDEVPDARLGSSGWYVYDTVVGQAGPGRVYSTRKNRYRMNKFKWRYVDNSRVWDASESNGTYFVFFDEVLSKFYNFKLYRSIAEGTGTSDINLGAATVLPAANAYIMDPAKFPLEFPYAREFPGVEYLHPIELAVVEAPEYSNS